MVRRGAGVGAVAERVVEVGVRDLSGGVDERDDVLVGVGDIELLPIAQNGHVQPHGLPEVGIGQRVGVKRVVFGDLLEAVVDEEGVLRKDVVFIDLLLEAASQVVVIELQARGSLGGGDQAVLRVPGAGPAVAGQQVAVGVVGGRLRRGGGDGVVAGEAAVEVDVQRAVVPEGIDGYLCRDRALRVVHGDVDGEILAGAIGHVCGGGTADGRGHGDLRVRVGPAADRDDARSEDGNILVQGVRGVASQVGRRAVLRACAVSDAVVGIAERAAGYGRIRGGVHAVARDHLREAVVAVAPLRAVGEIHLCSAVRHVVNNELRKWIQAVFSTAIQIRLDIASYISLTSFKNLNGILGDISGYNSGDNRTRCASFALGYN